MSAREVLPTASRIREPPGRLTQPAFGRLRTRYPAVDDFVVSASFAYLTHFASSASQVDPAGTLYSNSTPAGMAHLLFFRHSNTSAIGVSPSPHGMFSDRS